MTHSNSASASRIASLFLNGSYGVEQKVFYRNAIMKAQSRGEVAAVDGALELFLKLGLRPSIVIGDFDSVSETTLKSFAEIPMVTFPRDKDATDGELAIRHLLEQGFDELEIFGAIDADFETDQMLANIFCLTLAKEYEKSLGHKIKMRLTDHRQYIYLAENETLELKGKSGNLFSIIPLSDSVTITTQGAKWELDRQTTQLGRSWTLRNNFAGEQVSIEVAGIAIIVHRYGKA